MINISGYDDNDRGNINDNYSDGKGDDDDDDVDVDCVDYYDYHDVWNSIDGNCLGDNDTLIIINVVIMMTY